MTKQIRRIYIAISIWLGIGLLTTFSQWARFINENELFGGQTRPVVVIMSLLFFFFVFWEIKGFIHLKKTQRWIGIIYFSIWSLNVVLSSLYFATKNSLTTGKLSSFLFILIINAVSIYFLTKQKYITLQEQFNNENEVIKLQKSISDTHQAPSVKFQKRIRWIIAIAVSVLVIIIYQALFTHR
ncbi:MAG TPA: hypothetical protein VLH56_02355 [Dissulfurispiraceae bacterium]|nr:hypothetical protein [Dissulfurispiraceae bacterium]